ncbi:MAG: hypothetical protein JW893_09625 [Candidatus Omnitrophica bacterium]|nr:hypothetical protein [Candidatus Omnitrophota bacterium]
MKFKKDNFFAVVIAILPVLNGVLKADESLRIAILVTGTYWGGIVFFGLCQNGFPQKLWRLGLIGWLAACAQIAYYLLGQSPVWVLSVLLLFPPSWFCYVGEETAQGDFKGLVSQGVTRGIGFFILVCYLGIFQEIFRERLLFWSFQGSVGAFLLLASVAFVWQNQPRKVKTEKEHGAI